MYETRTLICQCLTRYKATTRLKLTPGVLTLEHINEQKQVIARDELSLNEYPELKEIHDGRYWRLPEVWALLACLEIEGIEANQQKA